MRAALSIPIVRNVLMGSLPTFCGRFAAHVLWTVLIKSEFLVLKRKFGGLSSFSIGRQRSVCGLNALDVFFGLWVRGGVAKYLAPCRTHDLGLIRPMLLMEQ